MASYNLWLTVTAVLSICGAASEASRIGPQQLTCSSGALSKGTNLRVANLTIAAAAQWCTHDTSCAGFTTRASTCDPTNATAVHHVYFKSSLGGNGDPSWSMWQKDNFTAPLFYCSTDKNCQMCLAGTGQCDRVTYRSPSCFNLCNTSDGLVTPSQSDGVESYIDLYPLVLMDMTERTMLGHRSLKNRFVSNSAFVKIDDHTVVRPNVDTLYTLAWLTFQEGPLLLDVPDTDGRYYVLQMLDAYTNTFAAPGSRTTGTKAQRFVLVGPAGWNGTIPRDATRIEAPTNTVWVLGRIQANGPIGYPAVHALQKGFHLTPLTKAAVAKASAVPSLNIRDPPTAPELVSAMSAEAFFTHAASLLALNPISPEDDELLARLARIGVVPGQQFEWHDLSPALRLELGRAIPTAKRILEMNARDLPFTTKVNGWSVPPPTIGNFSTQYLERAAIAMIGLGANLPDDAIYLNCQTVDGKFPLSGGERYLVHFAAGDLPPVRAFWSITVYDKAGFFVPNSIDRYAMHGWDNMTHNVDGSLDVFIQSSPPTQGTSNWLPTPTNGTFSLMTRLYWPTEQILNGTWAMPAVKIR